MEQLKLHSFGKNDHLEALKKKYEALKKNISENINGSESKKKEALTTCTTSFEKEKKDSKYNLY